ncbi:zinc finger MYM-type protein 1-like [Clytia hemisphaerica]|uniref:zinc finger MYM-type protein 1-like n=1 Tax=Clytia hemisphaerica TaxID=252671 RepID=UPI0034D3CD64
MQCLRYLARQGLALQGTHQEDNFTQLLLLLGTKDPSIVKALDQSARKYTHHDVQNELLDIVARQVLSAKLEQIQQNDIFSIMCDEYTDQSNKEQMTFCVRTVDNQLEVEEDFLGYYEVHNIKSDTLVAAIKDILLRLNLPLESCRGQTYDGASNMFGKKSGVATQILTLQPMALAIHCFGHSLSLAVKDLTSCCKTIGETMSTAGEICILVKYSPKREKMLGEMSSNIEVADDVAVDEGTSLDKLSETRWTVRANCFQKIIDSYSNLQSLWDLCLAENLTKEVKSRIVGCQAQMKKFSFFFGLCLGQRLFSLTDNLSKTLQKESMSAVEGYKQDAPAHHPKTPEDHYREIYNEAIDAVSQALTTRFDQKSYKAFSALEQLLLKGVESKPYEEELAALNTYYPGDVDATALPAELEVLKTLAKGENPTYAAEIFNIMKAKPNEVKLLPNIVKIAKLLLVNGATTATPERTFSTARRLKSWIRATMKQKRFNSLAILNTYKYLTDKIDFVKVGNFFVDNQEVRLNYFGKFVKEDLQ